MASLRSGEAGVAMFHYLQLHSPLGQYVRQVPGRLCRDNFVIPRRHCARKLENSGKEFFETLSAKARKHQRQRAKKIQEACPGNVGIRLFTNNSELNLMIADAEQVAKKTYQRGLGVGFANTPDIHRSLELAARKGWLYGNILYADGKPIAFWIGTVYQGTFYSDYLGFDPDYSRFSPGMYVALNVLEELCDKRRNCDVCRVDFGIGEAEYKANLSNETWEDALIYLYGPGLAGMGLKTLRTSVEFADWLAKGALRRTQLLPRLKKVWRKHASHDTQ